MSSDRRATQSPCGRRTRNYVNNQHYTTPTTSFGRITGIGLGTIGECIVVGVDYVGTRKTNREGGTFGKTTRTDTKGWTRGQYRACKTTINDTNVYVTQ